MKSYSKCISAFTTANHDPNDSARIGPAAIQCATYSQSGKFFVRKQCIQNLIRSDLQQLTITSIKTECRYLYPCTFKLIASVHELCILHQAPATFRTNISNSYKCHLLKMRQSVCVFFSVRKCYTTASVLLELCLRWNFYLLEVIHAATDQIPVISCKHADS